MKTLLLTSAAMLPLLLSGCGSNYEYDGLYNNGAYISPDHSVKFCTVRKGNTSISQLMSLARHNAAIETNLSEVKNVNVNELKELALKYKLEGEVRFTIGTSVGEWRKLGYTPFEYPCLNNDNVLNFIHHVNTPYRKKSKDDITDLKMNEDSFNHLQGYLKTYKNAPVYGLLWEAVPGRAVDKGWVFKIKP